MYVYYHVLYYWYISIVYAHLYILQYRITTVFQVSSGDGADDSAAHVGAMARRLIATVPTPIVAVLDYLPVKRT